MPVLDSFLPPVLPGLRLGVLPRGVELASAPIGIGAVPLVASAAYSVRLDLLTALPQPDLPARLLVDDLRPDRGTTVGEPSVEIWWVEHCLRLDAPFEHILTALKNS